MIPETRDLSAEADEFDGLLASLVPDDWTRATAFKSWTIDDIVRHLHMGDRMALAAATDTAAFRALQAEVQAKRATGLSRLEETRQRLDGLAGPTLRAGWRETLERLIGVLETWSHAQAIWDLLGRERPAPPMRLRNIAELGVRTFGWAYRNRGLPVPAVRPHIRLAAPDGGTWEWNDPDTEDRVSGDALAFCQVVTQTRNAADTTLAVDGATAQHWMTIVQCFAGPPEDPPKPGTRRRSRAFPGRQ
jgi:uncharacterized protein (TIGR03083 family)